MVLENKMRNIKVEPNDSASEGEASKVKKTRGKKPRSKSVHISETPTPKGPEGLHGEELRAFCEKDVKEDEKTKQR